MNFKELKEIIDLVTSTDSIEELEIEKSGVRLRVKRASNHQPALISTAPDYFCQCSAEPDRSVDAAQISARE